jgi:uncharacterized membrane protein YidH (DUF202 family)
MIFAVVIAIILVIIGIFLIIANKKYNKSTQGDVKTSRCYYNNKGKNKCDLIVSYKASGKEYTNSMSVTSSKRYKAGDKIKIDYKSSDPSESRVYNEGHKYVGPVLMIIAIIILIIAFVRMMIASKIKGGGSALLAMNTLSAIRGRD